MQKLFHTRQRANEGIILPLSTPAGEATEHWIKIRGVDSDAYKEALATMRRKIFEASADPDKKIIDKLKEESDLKLVASLVVAWSFEESSSEENIVSFLREAPQIAEQIDRLSARRNLFFAKSLTASTPLPAPISS